MLARLLAVAVGGALGAVSRYLLSAWVTRLTPSSVFPYGTLAVNVLGSFLLGLLIAAGSSARFDLSPQARLLLGVGFLGSLTTFSTFSYETLAVLRTGEPRIALLSIAANVLVSLAACWLGMTVGARG